MNTYLQRFLAGEHEQVWAELGALPAVPDDLAADVTAVADETMRRVAAHVRRLAAAYTGLGLRRPGPLHEPPTAGDLADLARLEAETGGLPIALAACMRHVGWVRFSGDCPELGLYYEDFDEDDNPLPDPLVVPGVDHLRLEWDDYGPGPFSFTFSPDALTKSNTSGLSYDITLPSRAVDPVLSGTAETLVGYLRESIAWGGLPGWREAPADAPDVLLALRVTPDF